MAPSPNAYFTPLTTALNTAHRGTGSLRRLLRAHRQGSRGRDDEAGQQRRGRSRRAALIHRSYPIQNAMPPSPSDLPPWLRRIGRRPARDEGRARRRDRASRWWCSPRARGRGSCTRAETSRRSARSAPAGLSAGGRVPAPSGWTSRRAPAYRAASKRAKPTQKTLSPLPEQAGAGRGGAHAGAEGVRRQERARAARLRPRARSRSDPQARRRVRDRSDGAVDFVQILGADGSPKDVKRCYVNHLKRWRFPEELLRGEEKLLVNFVL